MRDPIVEEVRRLRDEHSRSFGYDFDAICDAYERQQVRAGDRLVRLGPKLLADRSTRSLDGTQAPATSADG